MAQAVLNLCVRKKAFLKHQVNWNTVCGAMQDLPWCNIWSADIPVEVFKMSICCCWLDILSQPRSSMWATRILLGLMINAGMLLASSRRLIFSGPVITLGLTLKSLYTVKWELMKPTRKPSISLVTETGIFLWMPSLLISGDPLLSLLCSACVRHCHCLLVEVVDWCPIWLAKLICSRIILTASSPGSLLICRSLRSLAIRLRDLLPSPSGRVRSGVSYL